MIMNNKAIIESLGGIDTVNARIRELAKPIAESRGLPVDEFLASVCCSEGPGYETTYGDFYRRTYLDGIRESLEGRIEQRAQDEKEFSELMLETIKNVMESMSLSPEEVMEAMKIPESDRDKYLAEILSTAG